MMVSRDMSTILVLILGYLCECNISKYPENSKRLRINGYPCENSSWFHRLPDKDCNMHTFCAEPLSPPPIDIFLIDKGELISERIINIPKSNTVIYEHLSHYVCRYFRREVPYDDLLKNITSLLGVKFDRQNFYRKDCPEGTKYHYIPSFDCKFKWSCVPSKKIPPMNIYVYNETAAENGSLLRWEFDVGYSNDNSYYQLAFVFCELERADFSKVKWNNSDNIEKYSTNNVTENSGAVNKGIIAGSVTGCIVLLGIGILLIVYIRRRYTAEKSKRHLQRQSSNGDTIDLDKQLKDSERDQTDGIEEKEEPAVSLKDDKRIFKIGNNFVQSPDCESTEKLNSGTIHAKNADVTESQEKTPRFSDKVCVIDEEDVQQFLNKSNSRSNESHQSYIEEEKPLL